MYYSGTKIVHTSPVARAIVLVFSLSAYSKHQAEDQPSLLLSMHFTLFIYMALFPYYFPRRVIALILVLALSIGSKVSATEIEDVPDDGSFEEEVSLTEMETKLRGARQEIARHVWHIKHLMHSSAVSFSALEAKEQVLSEATIFLRELDETLGIRSNAQGGYHAKQVAMPDLCPCIPPTPSTSHLWCVTPAQAVVPLLLSFLGLCWLKEAIQSYLLKRGTGIFS